MKHSCLLNNLYYILELCTSPDKSRLRYLVLFRLCQEVLNLSFTLSCATNTAGNVQGFSMYHDLIMSTVIVSVEIGLIKSRSQLITIITNLMEFKEIVPGSAHGEIVKDFNRKVDLYGRVLMVLYVGLLPPYSAAPFVASLIDTAPSGQECIDVGVGWVPSSLPYWFLLSLYINSVIMFLTTGVILQLWFALLNFSILKIRSEIKFLCADLNDLNVVLAVGPDFGPTCSSTTIYWEEDSLIRTKMTGFGENEGGFHNKSEVVNLDVQAVLREQVQRQRINSFVANIVEQHINVIRNTHLIDRAYRRCLLAYVQMGIITVTIGLPNLSRDLWSIDGIIQIIEMVAFLAQLGVVNYFGQTLLDESERLRQALYNCDWTDKPYSLRRDLLIMQIVATKPLRLTVGSVYTLGLETYAKILNATYTYGSLIQSLT